MSQFISIKKSQEIIMSNIDAYKTNGYLDFSKFDKGTKFDDDQVKEIASALGMDKPEDVKRDEDGSMNDFLFDKANEIAGEDHLFGEGDKKGLQNILHSASIDRG
jgi:hypothetical protein